MNWISGVIENDIFRGKMIIFSIFSTESVRFQKKRVSNLCYFWRMPRYFFRKMTVFAGKLPLGLETDQLRKLQQCYTIIFSVTNLGNNILWASLLSVLFEIVISFVMYQAHYKLELSFGYRFFKTVRMKTLILFEMSISTQWKQLLKIFTMIYLILKKSRDFNVNTKIKNRN